MSISATPRRRLTWASGVDLKTRGPPNSNDDNRPGEPREPARVLRAFTAPLPGAEMQPPPIIQKRPVLCTVEPSGECRSGATDQLQETPPSWGSASPSSRNPDKIAALRGDPPASSKTACTENRCAVKEGAGDGQQSRCSPGRGRDTSRPSTPDRRGTVEVRAGGLGRDEAARPRHRMANRKSPWSWSAERAAWAVRGREDRQGYHRRR